MGIKYATQSILDIKLKKNKFLVKVFGNMAPWIRPGSSYVLHSSINSSLLQLVQEFQLSAFVQFL